MDPPRPRPTVPALQVSGNVLSKRNPSELDATPGARDVLQSERVSLDWDDDTSSFQLEAECTETKTITTTTVVKRTYPSLVVRPERYLCDLDEKRYPLANHATPSNLLHLSYLAGEQSPPSLSRPASKIAPTNDRFAKLRYDVGHDTRVSSLANLSSQQSGNSKPPRSPDSMHHPSSSRFGQYSLRKPSTVSLSTPSRKVSDLSSSFHTSRLVQVTGAERSSRPRSFEEGIQSGDSILSSTPDDVSSCEGGLSPSMIPADVSFPAVATPPITDTDHGPFDQERVSAALSNIEPRRSTLTSTGLQSASLPSPSLSPTLAAAKLHDAIYPRTIRHADDNLTKSQYSDHDIPTRDLTTSQASAAPDPGVRAIQSMIGTFDAMPEEMKSFVLFQMLKGCQKQTLYTVADAIYPALKCDFLGDLPYELSLQILSFLDYKDLCRASQVSRQWRNIIDSNERGWKELFDKANFKLGEGELLKAISEGWGWQDPVGQDGYEMDLSRLSVSSGNAEDGVKEFLKQVSDPVPTRSSHKRKRTGHSGGREHVKRQKELFRSPEAEQRRLSAEGPLGAALVAATKVPNPHLGLPSLQKMHLYKSLFRRHHLIRHSWLDNNIQPHHMAFPAHGEHVITCLQFDDDKIITGSDDTFIHVYDTKTGALRKRLQGHEGGVWALQYIGNTLVSGSTDRSVRVWDIQKGRCTQVFHGHTSTVRCLQIVMPTPTGRTIRGKAEMLPEKPLIITGSRDSQLRVWTLPTSSDVRRASPSSGEADSDCPYFVRTLMGHAHSVRAIAAHSDMLVSGSYDFTVRVWKISTGETEHILRGHVQKVYSVVLDTPRKRCISGSMDFTVKIWSTVTGECLRTLEGHTSLVGLLDLQDNRLVSAAADATLRVWDPETGLCKSTLSAHTGAITCFQHDGEKVISGSDRTLKMWNVKTGECVQDLLTDLTGVWQVRFDSRRCVAAVQREGSNTYLEVLDFGASRDGIAASKRGHRQVLPGAAIDRVVDVDDLHD